MILFDAQFRTFLNSDVSSLFISSCEGAKVACLKKIEKKLKKSLTG